MSFPIVTFEETEVRLSLEVSADLEGQRALGLSSKEFELASYALGKCGTGGEVVLRDELKGLVGGTRLCVGRIEIIALVSRSVRIAAAQIFANIFPG